MDKFDNMEVWKNTSQWFVMSQKAIKDYYQNNKIIRYSFLSLLQKAY